MKTYNFDEVIDRKGTNSYKMDLCNKVFGTTDLLPLWVADMDFRTPDFIFDAIRERCEHPILGYSLVSSDFFVDLQSWIKKIHNWDVKTDWLGFLPGIVPGLAFAVNAFTQVGDEVIVQPPVYPPFLHVPANNGRTLVENPLKVVDGKFEMDFDDLLQKITPRTKMFILCNPHNPGGRIWTAETLCKLAEICAKNNILVISDEIHSDMALKGNKHLPFASVSDLAAQNSITYMAPSKTFNIAGMITSSYIIPNPELRTKFATFLANGELGNANLLSVSITRAAYQQGAEWREQMLDYVQANADFVIDYLKTNNMKVKPMIPEASFLLWLDFSEYGYSSEELQKLMVYTAKVGMNQGTNFGTGGEQHLRLNIGCPRSVLAEALDRIKRALS